MTGRRYPPGYSIFLWQKILKSHKKYSIFLHTKDIKITFSLLQLSMHSCSEHSSNLSCAQRDQYCPRVLVCIMGQRCHGWVELDPGMHIFQGIQEQFQESYSVDGKINVQDTSTCPALVPERNWSWPCFLSSSLCTSLTFLPCSVTALTIPHPCVSAASRF